MAILEAAQFGKPTIGPHHGGFTEIIGEGEAAIGRLFAPGDVDDLDRQVAALWNLSLIHILYSLVYTPMLYLGVSNFDYGVVGRYYGLLLHQISSSILAYYCRSAHSRSVSGLFYPVAS